MLICLLLSLVWCQTVRHLDYGSFRGRKSLNGKSISFYSIPYAAAPVGSLRFRPPKPPVNMSTWGIQDKTNAGPSCMVDSRRFLNFKAKPSEDCLQLNVYIPASARAGDNLPVMVYVYGGGFANGYSTFPYGRGARNILNQNHKVIIVTMNYRLAIFGFLPAAQLRNEGGLNLGIQDVAASFQWIRKYIYEFGGNPRQVTAFGLSAGGMTIASLMLARNGTMDLFDRAVLHSGSTLPILDQPERVVYAHQEIARRLNCTMDIECLRKQDADKLVQVSEEVTMVINSPLTQIYGPVLDNDLIQRQPSESLALGLYRKIPVMVTNVEDEGMFFTVKLIKTEQDALEWERRLFGFMNATELAGLNALYPEDSSPLPFHRYSQMLTDFYFQCPSRRLAQAYQKAGLPVYRVLLKHQLSLLKLPFVPKIGIPHGADLPFWWFFQIILNPKGQESELARVMLQGLIDFSSCPEVGECKISGLHQSLPWPVYNTTAQGARLDLKLPTTEFVVEPDTNYDFRCNYYDQVVQSKGDQIQGQFPPTKLMPETYRPHPLESLLQSFPVYLTDD